jgi:hypothetical protein
VSTTPRSLDVDHFIPLKEAHVSGAWRWSKSKKRLYANYMKNSYHLVLVRGRANRSKGAKDPANWMPPNRAYWCEYLRIWITIKRQWRLTMNSNEAFIIKKGQLTCKLHLFRDNIR